MAGTPQPERSQTRAAEISGAFDERSAPFHPPRDGTILRKSYCGKIAHHSISSMRAITFLNERLAKLYGIPGVKGHDFVKM